MGSSRTGLKLEETSGTNFGRLGLGFEYAVLDHTRATYYCTRAPNVDGLFDTSVKECM